MNAATQYQLTTALDQLADDLAAAGWQLNAVRYTRTLATRGQPEHEQLGVPTIEVELLTTDAQDGGTRRVITANGWPGVFTALDEVAQ